MFIIVKEIQPKRWGFIEDTEDGSIRFTQVANEAKVFRIESEAKAFIKKHFKGKNTPREGGKPFAFPVGFEVHL